MAIEKITIQIGDEIQELKGAEKEAFIFDKKTIQEIQALLKTEFKAKQEARDSAIKKLAEVAGLTEAELNAIL